MRYIFGLLLVLFLTYFGVFFASQNNFVYEKSSLTSLTKKVDKSDLPAKITGDNDYISNIFLLDPSFKLSSDKCFQNINLNGKNNDFSECEKNIFLSGNIGYNNLKFSLKQTGEIKNFELNKNIQNYLFLSILFFGLFVIFYTKNFEDKNYKFSIFSLIILFFASRIFLVSNIDYKSYSRDYDGHLEYINYIKNHFSLPDPLGWQTHQLPGYYFVSGAVSKISQNLGINQYLSLQLLASIFSFFTFFFFFKILGFFGIDRKNKILITLLLTSFWGIGINSIKIGNDPASYFGFMGFFYFLLKRGKNPSYNHFLPVIFWTILSIYMKKTNMVVLPLLAIFVTYIFLKDFKSRQCWRKFRLKNFLKAVSAREYLKTVAKDDGKTVSDKENLNIGNEENLKTLNNEEFKIHDTEKNKNLFANQNFSAVKKYLLLGFGSLFLVFVSLLPRLKHLEKYNINFLEATPDSVKVADRLKVENNPQRYYFPSLKNFFDVPYTSTADDKLGRNNFWEFLTKTGFWGEFGYQKDIFLMKIILIIGCLMGLITIIYFFLNFGSFWFLGVAIVLWVLSLLYFFYGHSYACNQDFRYILPVGFLGSIIFSHSMQKYKLQPLVYIMIFLNFIFMFSNLN